MSRTIPIPPAERAALDWIARVGAADAASLALHLDRAESTAAGRLRSLRAAGLVQDLTLIAGGPPLWRATAVGLRRVARAGLPVCRVSAGSAAHVRGCAELAAVLEQRHPDHVVLTERELIAVQRGRRGEPPLCGPVLEMGVAGRPRTHRPDLVLWPREGGDPVAIELELTVKAPARLQELCRAWARCREVAGVVYYASGPAERALCRAVSAVRAEEAVVVVPLGAVLASGHERKTSQARRTVRRAFKPTEGGSACRTPASTASP
ncbi:MAG TPA: hypothetical protein VHX88_19075 [Solirubrobacteraceae bacterium]|jgi:hypothetical protein|nr:hypothetical protein [Solirubrobacteraceae bacterium]